MWTNFDEQVMTLALEQARTAAEVGEVPVGAVVIQNSENGFQIITRTRNQKEELRNAQGHAELLALSSASQTLGRWRLTDCHLYVTLEPCLMCAGALLHSRLASVTFGARDSKFGGVRSLYSSLEDARTNHQVSVREGLFAEESSQLLRAFFQKRRSEGVPRS